jgi:hypothetical protein
MWTFSGVEKIIYVKIQFIIGGKRPINLPLPAYFYCHYEKNISIRFTGTGLLWWYDPTALH